MKKTVQFEVFGDNQYLFFDIQRLAQFEAQMGESLMKTIGDGNVGIRFCLVGLSVGLQHHYHKGSQAFWAEKLNKYFAEGGKIDAISVPIINAIQASGIFGDADASDDEPDVKNSAEVSE